MLVLCLFMNMACLVQKVYKSVNFGSYAASFHTDRIFQTANLSSTLRSSRGLPVQYIASASTASISFVIKALRATEESSSSLYQDISGTIKNRINKKQKISTKCDRKIHCLLTTNKARYTDPYLTTQTLTQNTKIRQLYVPRANLRCFRRYVAQDADHTQVKSE